MSEFLTKVENIRAVLSHKGLDAAVIRRNPNLAWLISGRVHVPSNIEMACFDLVISMKEVFAVTNAIEAPRLKAEEFPKELEVKIVPWWEGRDPLLPTGANVGSDQPGADRSDIGLEIEQLRQNLSREEINRYQKVCSDSARALGEALRNVSSTDREIDVAGAITDALWKENLDIAYMGVAGADRVKKFRHALPSDALIGNRVVASICARRKGLVSSVTRIVTFGELPDSEYREYLGILNVEAAMFNATVVGQPFSAPIEAAVAAYPANNFDVNEWHNHHQGGPMGFLPRDWTASLSTTRTIANNQAIAWNPTGKGWKAEDTIITTASGIEILTNDSSWPTLQIAGRTRPDLLKR
mgnify:CR=1 FL=1